MAAESPEDPLRAPPRAPVGLHNPACLDDLNANLQQLYAATALRDRVVALSDADLETTGSPAVTSACAVVKAMRDLFRNMQDAADAAAAAAAAGAADAGSSTDSKTAATPARSPSALAVATAMGRDSHVAADSEETVAMLVDALDTVAAQPGKNLGDLCASIKGVHVDLLRAYPMAHGAGHGDEATLQVLRESSPVRERRRNDTVLFSVASLRVRGVADLAASLADFVKPELLGDAYHWEDLDGPVITTKGSLLGAQLPQYLHFGLKRFEFNFETFASVKVNDRFEFPMVIDMAPYVDGGGGEGASAGDSSSGTGAGDADSAAPSTEARDTSTRYVLRGVTRHTGSASGGNYDCLVHRSIPGAGSQWYQCDTHVRPFDVASLPDACFGGTRQADGGRTLERNDSAVALFYERDNETEDGAALGAGAGDSGKKAAQRPH